MRGKDVGEQAVSDALGGGLHRLRRKVGVTCGRLRLTVAEQPADHRQAVAPGERPRGEAVP